MRKALQHLKAADPVMARIIEKIGPYKIAYREPDFTTLARSIVYQQVSGAAAATMLRRLTEAAGQIDGRLDPRRIAALGLDGMRPCGISRQKAAYLINVSETTLSGELDLERLPRLSNERVIARLTQVKGIGVWTAQMFLMFALRRPNVLPTGDLGVKNAIQREYGLETPPSPRQIAEHGACWQPFASVASWYLWRCLDGAAEI
jgi:DNA-3-methyladenine glycosylase II